MISGRGDGGPPSAGPPTGDAPGELLRAGARGALWQGMAQIVGKSVVLVATVVLARLLAPGEYGLVALALVLVSYAEAIADAGVAQALIYLPRSRESARAASACSLGAGVALVLLGVLAAPLIGDLFGRPDVIALVRLLSVSLLAAALAATPEALLRRDLLFQRLTVATVLRAVVTGGVSVVLAFAGYGAWSIAWGAVAGAATYAAAAWLLLPERPDVRFWRSARSDLRAVLGYGAPVASSSLLGRLIFDADYLIVGGVLGAEALGYYTLAFRIPELLIINFFYVLASVTFPLYARARSDPERLRRGYLLSIRVQALYGVSAGVGLAVVASALVPVIFGDKWAPAVSPLIALALYAACRSIGAGANEVYKALGRPGLAVKLSILRFAILVPALWFATRWGFAGVAWAQLCVAAVFLLLMQGLAAHVLELRWRELVVAVAPALLAGGVVAAVGLLFASVPLPQTVGLVLTVFAGVVAAGLAIVIAYPALLRELLSMISRGRADAP